MSVFVVRPDDSVYSINRQVALVGFTLRGEDIKLFEAAEIDKISISTSDIVFGGVRIVHRAFDRLGWEVAALDSVPESLSDFAARKTWQATLGDARRIVENGEAVFIKPVASQLKLFNGQVLRKFSDLIASAHLSDDTPVECAEVIPFLSEFRAFVLHGTAVGLRHYAGDPLRFPDAQVIQAIISQHHTAPVSYALDIGVVEDGRTLLVEINDSFATGAYGLAPGLYASIIDARWNQLRQQHASSVCD